MKMSTNAFLIRYNVYNLLSKLNTMRRKGMLLTNGTGTKNGTTQAGWEKLLQHNSTLS
jgi:hypothetical protein